MSILFVVEPVMPSNESTLIGVAESLQKEINNKRIKNSLKDFTMLF